MAPRPLPQSCSSPFPPSTTAHYNGIQQWHHVQLAVTLPSPNHSTLQWHPAMAPCPLPQSWSSPSPPTIVRWHPAMAPRPLHPAMAPWCHVQSAKVVRCLPPLLGVRTPLAIAIWGIIKKGSRAKSNGKWKSNGKCSRSRNQFL